MLSLKGSANAATAAAPATPADTRRNVEVASEQATPVSARMPAKPSPQCKGTEFASTMPVMLASCQLAQFRPPPPAR